MDIGKGFNENLGNIPIIKLRDKGYSFEEDKLFLSFSII